MLRSPLVSNFPDCQDVLKDWKDKYDQNLLQPSDVVAFLEQTSPFLLSIEPMRGHQMESVDGRAPDGCVFDENGAKSSILELFETMICGDNPSLILERIKNEDDIPSVCGRVFKCGEPTYSCRECGMDPTCVLCASCFNKSSHRNHKYKMATSGGGGCCDCGDKEAWKRDPYCEDHMMGAKAPKDSNIVTPRMKQMCAIAFKGILKFCMQSFQLRGDNTSPLEYDGDTFCTILYNDEVHTFDQVTHFSLFMDHFKFSPLFDR